MGLVQRSRRASSPILWLSDKDYFSCAEDEISFLTPDLTMVDRKIVYGAGDFAALDENSIPPAMPAGRRRAASGLWRLGRAGRSEKELAPPHGGRFLRLCQHLQRSRS